MRNKLAFTLALAVLVAALGGGLANGAGPVSVINGQVSAILPGGHSMSVGLPECADGIDNDGDGRVDLADPDCVASGGTTESDPATVPGTGGGGTTITPGTTTTPSGSGTTTTGSGSTSVTVTPSTASGGNGKNGGGNGQTGGVGPGKSKNQGKNQQKQNKIHAPPPYQANGTPTVGNPTTTIASFGPAPIGVPNFVIDQFEIPPFLLPIYQACGTEYQIPWQVLASINKIETAFGTNLNVSSAGAMGWMQFIPSTWQAYGVDANGDGRKDPYNPVDAICAAARYLRAAGGDQDLRSAIFSYNHASWYVDEVMLGARSYGKIPDALLGSLTGLTQGAHFPVAANARYADDISARQAIHDSKTGRKQYGNAAHVIESAPNRRSINIFSRKGAPVVAVNDGMIRKIGKSPKLGRFIVLQDTYGNIFTYANLGQLEKVHPVPKPQKIKGRNAKPVGPPQKDRKPTAPASKGAGNYGKASIDAKGAGDAIVSIFSKLATSPAPAPAPSPKAKQSDSSLGGQLDSIAGQKVPAYSTFKHYFSNVLGLNKKNSKLVPLREGSYVVGGTVLAGVPATSKDGTAPHINFAIKPVGRGAPTIDPKPILDGWKLLESTAIYRAAGKNPFASNLGVGGVLLMSKEALMRRVLADPRIQIYPCGRNDIQTGQIDRPVLATMEYLVQKGFSLTITSLKCGHSFLTSSGNQSEHTTGDAMDIAAINGVPVMGHQGPGTLADSLVKTTLELQGSMQPHQVISLEDLPGPVSFALADHADHVHVGFQPLYGSGYYQDPFLDASAIQGRTDMGVDYAGTGPIEAIGNAQILKTGAPGWPQGGGVVYKLLDGPHAGDIIFVYEGVTPTVHAGQKVLVGQQIASFMDTGSIEIGFADANGVPLGHAGYSEGDATVWGQRMKSFLASIGGATGAQFTSMLNPGQWQRLITRLGQIQNPTVPTTPSKASIPVGNKQASQAHKGD